MSKVVDALKAEIVELENQLSGDARYMRVQELKRIVTLYEEAPETPRKRKARSKRSGSAASVAAAAKEVLAGATEPMATRDVLQTLQERGVKVSGEAPHSTLSAILSKSPDFKAHGRSGWTSIAPNGQDAEPAADAQDATVPASEPSEPVAPSA